MKYDSYSTNRGSGSEHWRVFKTRAFSQIQPLKGINLFMIDMNGDALASISKEFEVKYKNVTVLTKKLDLTTLQNQIAYDELDAELA